MLTTIRRHQRVSEPGPQQENQRSPFGEMIYRLRTARGLTQEQLALSTKGDRIAPRSITSYEKKARRPDKWVLPHRPVMRLLADAMELDLADRHQLAVAWHETRKLRDVRQPASNQSDFIPAGREFAVKHILNAWQKAQDGTPQLVLLSGVAGIGKSALIQHVIGEIASSSRKVMIGQGAASSWATDMEPYLALRTATDSILGGPSASSTASGNYPSRPKLGPDEIQRVIDAIPFLGGPIVSEGALRRLAETSPAEERAAITSLLSSRGSTHSVSRLDEYAHLLEHFAQSWPLVLVLEDLHWAGAQTTNLLLHLGSQMQHMRNTPILVICTFRNDEVHSPESGNEHPLVRLIDLMSDSPQVTSIFLNESVSHTYGMDFVRAMADQTPTIRPEDSTALAEYLFEQTFGHPLLAIELKRHLLESNSLVLRDDQMWEFRPDSIPKETPSAISTFIAQRLKRVSRQSKQILEIASVMNDVILPAIIADVMDEDEDDVVDTIERELVESHQLLLPAPPVQLRQVDYSTYRFPHALFREHIYNQIAGSRRRRLHSSIAEAMEAESGEFDTTALSEITSHYVLAENWEQAQMSGFRLALHAAFKMDWDLAELWFPQAEELALRARDHQQLWKARAARLGLLRGTSRYDEAIELGERILKLVDIHDWPSTLALTCHYMGEIHYDLGKLDIAVDYLERALLLHQEDGAVDFAAAALAMMSHATHRQGKYDVARMHAQAALALSKEFNNFWVQPEALFAMANCEIDLGLYDQALQSYSVVGDLATMVGKLQTQFIPKLNVALTYTFMGSHTKAIDQLTQVIEQLEALNLTRYLPSAYLYIGYAYEAEGNYHAAAKAYARTTEMRRSDDPPPTLLDSVAGELRVALVQRDSKTARRLMREIVQQLEKDGIEGIEYPLRVLVSVANAREFFGDSDGYSEYVTWAHDVLMERAKMIEDEASRTSFLTNVSTAVDVQERYNQLDATIRER